MDASLLDLSPLRDAVRPWQRDNTPVPEGDWPTVTKEGTPYLSPSARNLYENCTQAWKYRYMDRLPSKPSPDASTGTFLHAVMEQALAAQMGGDEWTAIQVGDAVRAAAPDVADAMDPELVSDFLDTVPATAAAAAKAWALWHGRHFHPVEVERRRTVFVGDLEVHGLGIMDVLAETPDGLAVIDWKFPRKGAWHGARPRMTALGEMVGDMKDDHVLACSLYADAAQAERDDPIRWIATINAPRTPEAPAYLAGMPWDRDRTTQVHAAWGKAIQGIRSGHFVPKARATWMCNERFCDYWDVCPGGRSAKA